MKVDLARLESVDIRDVWKHEAKDFTQWLAKPENLRLLGETIGLELEPIEPESKVGKFSADIFAKDVDYQNGFESSYRNNINFIIGKDHNEK